MRIERLEITGFKSFAEAARLEFGSGATAVVGPNGCGKSNIADAVFWVLGELGASTIRARGKELIFSGSALREPLGVAEVRLHVSGLPGAPESPGGPAGSGANSANGANGAGDAHSSDGLGAGALLPPAETPARTPTGTPTGTPAAELIVSRRVDATGQSVYEMDGRRCTRRDIQRLFAGTGLGPGSYALIEQGRANDVLSRKPDDLRLLVEEAVGLGAYRLNRRESEANLRAAERALERVRERLGELDRHIRTARRDSRTARRVQEASRQAALLRIAEQAARRDELLTRVREHEAPVREAEAERRRRSRSLAAFEGFVDGIRERAARAEVELREATRHVGEFGARSARAAALLDEGERSATVRGSHAARLAAEEEALLARLSELEAERRASLARAEEFPARLEQLQGVASERAARRDAAFAGEREAQAELWRLRRETDRLEAGVGAHRLSREQYAARRERLAAAGLRLAGARRELTARLEHVTREAAEAARRMAAHEEESGRLRAEVEAGERRWRAAAAAAESARSDEGRAERDLAASAARLESLEELVGSREQLGASAAEIVAAADRRGVSVGPAVGELVEVDNGYEPAAEGLLGVHRIRVEGISAALALVEELGGAKAAPSEVLVSELVEACGPADGPSHEPGGRSFADGRERLGDHLRLSAPELAAIVPDAVIAADLEEALAAFVKAPGLYVTRAGASVTPPGIVRFGRGGPGDGFLATRREIVELRVRRETRAAECGRLTRASKLAAQALDRAAAALETARADHGRAETEAEGLRLAASRQAEEVGEVRERLTELAAEQSRHAEEVERNDEDDRLAAEQAERDEARLGNARVELEAREASFAAARRELRAREQEWRDADREFARESAVADEVSGRALELQRQEADDRGRFERIQRERAAAGREEEAWRARREGAVQEREAAEAGARTWEEQERVLGARAEGFRARLEGAARAARNRAAEVRRVEERLFRMRSETQEAEGALSELAEEFRSAHSGAPSAGGAASPGNLEEAAASLPAELRGRSREDIRRELAEVQQRIERLGPVNEIAAERLRELEAERQAPEAHLRDVEQGIEDGRRAIARQDREAHRRFSEGFGAVSTGFDEAFRQLFGGGRAELRLVAPKVAASGAVGAEATDAAAGAAPALEPSGNGAAPEPAGGEGIPEIEEVVTGAGDEGGAAGWEGNGVPETRGDAVCGVEIAAQPPGKKLQSVRLLSGGEKALTAIAFMIALFRYRPAPFCLLDEVDAPLDDANVQRFAAMLDELKRDTQLVVITHNRLTMEACERLYGVTMEEPGVSRLISVELNDDVDAWIAGPANAGSAAARSVGNGLDREPVPAHA